MKKTSGLIFILSGPSGSGKTTLVRGLFKTRGLKNKLARSISFTTRPRRSGEKNQEDYFFISAREFKRRLDAKEILEHTRYSGYDYGTPRLLLEANIRAGQHVVLCLDLRGVGALKRLYPQRVRTIFVMPPSLEILRQRIKNRCSKTAKQEIFKRIKLAEQELELCRAYDYCLVNQDLKETVGALKKIILKEIG